MVPFITYIQLQRKMFSQPVVELCGYIQVVELENSAFYGLPLVCTDPRSARFWRS